MNATLEIVALRSEPMTIDGLADLLVETLGDDDTEAAMVMACAADVRTGLAGNPPYTMRVAVAKSVLRW